jgi:hypothetical protein
MNRRADKCFSRQTRPITVYSTVSVSHLCLACASGRTASEDVHGAVKGTRCVWRASTASLHRAITMASSLAQSAPASTQSSTPYTYLAYTWSANAVRHVLDPSSSLQSMSFSLGLESTNTMAYRSTVANVSNLPRPNVIRADPTMTTCFDPADKELYDLWAPTK